MMPDSSRSALVVITRSDAKREMEAQPFHRWFLAVIRSSREGSARLDAVHVRMLSSVSLSTYRRRHPFP
eukprot:scaffold115036_cov59-Attheya_sp.AAC.1